MSISPAWEDLDQFIDTDDFAVSATVTFRAGGIRRIDIIFDDPYVNAEAGGYERDDVKPKATAKLPDLAGISRFDMLTIDSTGTIYNILTNPKPDGTGLGVLELAVA